MRIRRNTILGLIVILCLLFAVFILSKSGGYKHEIIQTSADFGGGLKYDTQPFSTLADDECHWYRLCREPFPIYSQNAISTVNVSFKCEKIFIASQLHGVVMKDYTDLKYNEGNLSGIRFLMCFGRLGDSRTHKYLRQMRDLKAVTIFSPMPADIVALQKFCPQLEVLDLNCEYWNCECDLSVFENLRSLSIRGRNWKSARDGNETVCARLHSLYLENASPGEVPVLSKSLRTLELAVMNEEDIVALSTKLLPLGEFQNLILNTAIVPQSLEIAKLKNLCEYSVIFSEDCMKNLETGRYISALSSSFDGILLHSNVPYGEKNGKIPEPLYSYKNGFLFSTTSDVQRKIESEYYDVILYNGSGGVEKRISYLQLMSDPKLVEEARLKYPSRGLYLDADRDPFPVDRISELLKAIPKTWKIRPQLTSLKGRFTNDELKRMDIVLLGDAALTEELSQAERDAVTTIECTTNETALKQLAKFKKLECIILYLKTLKIGDFPPVGLNLESMLVVGGEIEIADNPSKYGELEDDDPEWLRFIAWKEKVIGKLLSISVESITSSFEFDGVSVFSERTCRVGSREFVDLVPIDRLTELTRRCPQIFFSGSYSVEENQQTSYGMQSYGGRYLEIVHSKRIPVPEFPYTPNSKGESCVIIRHGYVGEYCYLSYHPDIPWGIEYDYYFEKLCTKYEYEAFRY